MADMRKVRLSEGVNLSLGNRASSTYNYENRTYTLTGTTPMRVPLEVATAWVLADSNVIIMAEK
jgi:hypothetical protein